MKDNAAAMLVLEKYAKWLNLWGKKTEAPTYPWEDLTTEGFFKYNSTRLISDTEHGEWRLITILADYGDDGGGAYLVARFDKDWDYKDREYKGWRLKWIVQEFDTMPQGIYGDWIGMEFGWVIDTRVVADPEDKVVPDAG